MMDKRDLIKGIKDILGNIEYKPNSTGAGAVSLIGKDSEIVFSYKKYPEVYILGTQIIGYKSFSEVENILKPLYLKYKIGYQQYTIYKQSRRCEEIFNIELSSVSDLSKIESHLRLMVFDDLIPFFEEYQYTEQVLNKVNSLPKEDISRFLHLPPLPRIMILKRIHETNDWQEYCAWAVDIYKTMASGPNGQQHLLVSELISELQLYLRDINLSS